MTPLFIIGTGGHACDVAEVAAACGYRPIMVAADETARDAWDGTDEVVLEEALPGRGQFAIGVGDNRTRAALAQRLLSDRDWPTLVHPGATLARGGSDMLAAVRGTVVFPGVTVMGRCRIGHFCTLNLASTVSHDCVLGDFSTLSPGAHLAGNVHLGEGALVGMGAVINQGSDEAPRSIGAWSTVGSGAAVVRDVTPGVTVVGVPAKDLAR